MRLRGGHYSTINPVPYLSNILHDKRAFLDLLQGFYPPTSAVGGAKNAHLEFASFLHHTVWAVGSTIASFVALVDGSSSWNSQPPPPVVGKL